MGNASGKRRAYLLIVAIGFFFEFSFGLGFEQPVDFGFEQSVNFAVGFDFEFSVCNLIMDLTIIYLTLNVLPSRWSLFHLEALLRAAAGFPMVVSSREQMELDRPGTEYLLQTGPIRAWTVYSEILRAARIATTKFVAIAEDDTLYPARHFTDFRPPDDAVAYDMSRWSVFSWAQRPFFSAIRKHGNFTMIGPRQLVIDALEERETKYPHGRDYTGEIGRAEVEKILGVRRNKLVEWWCIEPMVNLCHPQGLSPTYIDTKGRERKPGELKAYDIPVWGKASDIAAVYNHGAKEDARFATTA